MDPGTRNTDLMGTTAAVARVAYSDLLTIVWASVLFSLSVLGMVTAGAGLVALSATMTAVVTGESRGGPTTERERLSIFRDAFREHLRRGVPYSVVLVAVPVTAYLYLSIALATGSGVFLVGSTLGGYLVVLAFVWCLRAASVVVRSSDSPGFVEAMGEAGSLLRSEVPYTTIHLLVAALLLLAAFYTQVGLVLVLPGLLALLEVVTFEEIAGERAETIVRAYRGELV